MDSPGAAAQALESMAVSVGDFEAAYAAAPVRIDARYSTPPQHQNPMELFATQCMWEGDRLVVHEPSQYVNSVKFGLAEQLGIDPERIRVISTYVGGAFGAKGFLTQRTALVALAARHVGRPVKLVPTREQGFTVSGYRAETRHHVQLAAGQDGRGAPGPDENARSAPAVPSQKVRGHSIRPCAAMTWIWRSRRVGSVSAEALGTAV
ncbi:molybdopterin cofactor-binding domain-containing protein [Skermanella mucosa]|uniref:molybdopterin cofactor-binding domain-containing protein n=1 Tax=Skermanella mucosa TaxID=1789672 RepID=UPI00192AF1ED